MHHGLLQYLLVGDAGRIAVVTVRRLLESGTVIFVATAAVAIVLTLVIREFAPHYGLVDRPDQHRKLHRRATPLGGGLAVFLAAASVLGALAFLPSPWQRVIVSAHSDLMILLLSGITIVGVGLMDDAFQLRGRVKLLGQIGAASIVVLGGLQIQSTELFGMQTNLGLLMIPFTLFWLLGAINSMNLLDGIDGLASLLGLILVLTIAAMGVLVGNPVVTIVGLVFAGALLGFLSFNFPPASIFLGDAGSMLIGLVVGVLAIRGALKGPGTVLLAAPLAVWTIPIFDSVAAIVRRKLTGRSIYAADRGHLHHRLLDLLGSHRKVLAWVAVFCALTSAGTLVSVFLKSDVVALVACSSIVVILVTTGIFGRAELWLLTHRLRKFGQSLLEPPTGSAHGVRQSTVRLQGSWPWELLWASLTESADKLGLVEVCLDVNLPRVQESYHAYWERPIDAEDDRPRRWRMEIPLMDGRQLFGSLAVAGLRHGGSACEDIEQLLAMLEPFEIKVRSLAGLPQAGREPVPSTLMASLPRVLGREQLAVERRMPK